MSNMENYGNANFNHGMSQMMIQLSIEEEYQKLDIDTRLKVMEILNEVYNKLLKEVQLP